MHKLRHFVCTICGQAFESRQATPQFCSVSCRVQARRIPRVTRICLYCGTPFEAHQCHVQAGRMKYCSVACTHAAQQARVECRCLICGTRFLVKPNTIRKGYGKYCSKPCQYQGMQAPAIERCCLHCGQAFTVLFSRLTRHHTRYCSLNCATQARTRPEEARFWEKVDMRGPEECWPWKGTLNNKGYGSFYVKRDGKKKIMSAHVYAWESLNGSLPEGLQGNHTCDCIHGYCVNPRHVYAGTQQQNMQDTIKRNRRKRKVE